MDLNRDGLLETVIKLAEEQSPAAPSEIFHVTLLVGGMLVSGRIIGRDEFMQHHPFVEKLWEKYPKPESEVAPAQRFTGKNERWFIHLAEARVLTPGATTTPAQPGAYWRGLLAEVAGFSFTQGR